MRGRIRLAAVASLMLGAGCISTTAQKAAGVDLHNYKTFAFKEPPPDDAKQAAFDRSLAGQTIRAQVATNLQNKGMVEAAPGQQADVMIAYHSNLRREWQYTDWGYGPGWGWGGIGYYGAPTMTSYLEGTIIIDFLDPRTHQVVWRGTASGTVNNPDNPDANRVAKAVDKVLKKYPVQMASAPPSPTM
jgi:hypothetical protein